MSTNIEKQNTATTKVPIDVHVFSHCRQYYAFDVRNYDILKIGRHGAAVLSRVRDLSLDGIIAELSPEIPTNSIRAHYLKFLELIRDGIVSMEPVWQPARPPFHRLVLMLAGGCNLGCTYCFEKDVSTSQKPNLMTQEVAEETLNWFIKHQEGKKAHIQLYGGEPLLNWPILKYVVKRMDFWAHENNIELTKYLITNGTLLNTKRIEFLKSHNVAIQVSVDGDADTHNRFRIFKSGKATMNKIKPNIEELLRQRTNLNLRAVLTRKNMDPNAVINGLRSFCCEKVSFEVVATDNVEAQLTNEDWKVFNKKYHDFVNSHYEIWNKLPDEMQSTIIRICERKRVRYGCGAGISEVTVAPDGSIYECQRLYRSPYSKISDDRSPTEIDSQILFIPVYKTGYSSSFFHKLLYTLHDLFQILDVENHLAFNAKWLSNAGLKLTDKHWSTFNRKYHELIYSPYETWGAPYSKVSDDNSPIELESPLLTTVDERAVCKDCWTRYLCGGGCWHLFRMSHGKDETPARSDVQAARISRDNW